MKIPHLPIHGQAGETKQEPSAHANPADLARPPAVWDPASFSQNTTARPTDWLELLSIRWHANETGWGAGSYLTLADCLEQRRAHESQIIPIWPRVDCGQGLAP